MDAFQSERWKLCLAGDMLAGERGFGRIVVETTNVVAQTGYEDLVASPLRPQVA